MDSNEFNKIFSRNLNYYIKLNNKSQNDLVKDLGFSKGAVSSWCNGHKAPRMDKVDMLCNYFKIKRSDLIEQRNENKESNTIEEHVLITDYRVLNGEDQELVIEFVKSLSSYDEAYKRRIKEYMQKINGLQRMDDELMAAHNDNATNDEELEKIKKDFEKF
jgi:transcriptional regulator with XRE-family HTH domain